MQRKRKSTIDDDNEFLQQEKKQQEKDLEFFRKQQLEISNITIAELSTEIKQPTKRDSIPSTTTLDGGAKRRGRKGFQEIAANDSKQKKLNFSCDESKKIAAQKLGLNNNKSNENDSRSRSNSQKREKKQRQQKWNKITNEKIEITNRQLANEIRDPQNSNQCEQINNECKQQFSNN